MYTKCKVVLDNLKWDLVCIGGDPNFLIPPLCVEIRISIHASVFSKMLSD